MVKAKLASGQIFALRGDIVSCEDKEIEEILQFKAITDYWDYHPSGRSREIDIVEKIIQDFGGEILQESDIPSEIDEDAEPHYLIFH